MYNNARWCPCRVNIRFASRIRVIRVSCYAAKRVIIIIKVLLWFFFFKCLISRHSIYSRIFTRGANYAHKNYDSFTLGQTYSERDGMVFICFLCDRFDGFFYFFLCSLWLNRIATMANIARNKVPQSNCFRRLISGFSTIGLTLQRGSRSNAIIINNLGTKTGWSEKISNCKIIKDVKIVFVYSSS